MPKPFPIIVGVPRSGTTMLRFMLCAGGTMVIPPETVFVARLSQDPATQTDKEAFLQFLERTPTWEDFGLTRDDLVARLPADVPFSAGDGVRAFYAAYAARHKVERAGDKTPVYLDEMQAVARILPEAVFIHLIRDGRDVATSWAETWFAPSKDPVALLELWAGKIMAGRAAAAGLNYVEVRYEDLTRDPALTLKRLCEVIDLPYAPDMCDPAIAARQLLPEHGDRHDAKGKVVVTRKDRLRHSALTLEPLTADRVGRWRSAYPRLEPGPLARGVLAGLGYV